MKEKRNNKRIDFRFIVNTGSDFGETLNISDNGASVLTREPVQVGSVLKVKNYFKHPVRELFVDARVVWSSLSSKGYISGLHFLGKNQDALSSFVNTFQNRGQFDILKWVLRIGILSIVLSCAYFWNRFEFNPYRSPFVVFILFLTGERVWETFFTSKEFRSMTSSSDWSMTAVSFYYIVLVLIVIAEFFLLNRPISNVFISFGAIFLFTSACLRWWAMKTLGSEWRVHATDVTRRSLGKETLVTRGPYSWIRHPIYLAVIVELIGIPLIAQAHFSLLFCLLVNVPLQVLRSRLEENKSIEIHGISYISYMNQVPAFIPKMIR